MLGGCVAFKPAGKGCGMLGDAVVVAAFTVEQAERLTGVSKRQLGYWDRTGFFIPSLAYGDRREPYSRLYSFRDLVCLKVVHALRNDSKVPLSHLREVKEKLAHLGEHLWAKTILYVLNRRVIFHNPETGAPEEVLSAQAILNIPLKAVSGEIETAVKALRQRAPDLVGKVERRRNVAGNQPVVAGTRILVRSIKAFADDGYSVEEIGKEYPILTEQDIHAAIEYKEAA